MWTFLSERMKMFYDAVLSDKDKIYSYLKFMELAEKNGKSLKTELPPHSKCAVICDSGLNVALALLSCWYADLVPIPMSKHYGERHCAAILELTEPDCVIADSSFDKSNSLIYRIDIGEFIGCTSLSDTESELQGVALIMCTSGTTGKPKGAMITESSLKENVLSIADYFALTQEDTILIARPLYHCAVLTGEFLISLYLGVNICFCDEKYNPSNIIELCRKFSVTVLCGTPTLFRQISLLSKRAKTNPQLHVIALSGECLTKEIASQIRETFPKTTIYHVYGLTEASPRVTYLPPSKFDSIPEAVGVPLNNTQIRIVAPESFSDLPLQTHGLVLVNSSSLMKGYYRDIKRTKKALLNGWLNTGDIGYIDENGFLFILSRADDMIIKAGMNIYPKEIETAISILPEIAGVVAYGVKVQTGQEIAVNVVLAKGHENTTVKHLLNSFEEILSNYQMPSRINIVDVLERNSSGKIVRPRGSAMNTSVEFERKFILSPNQYEQYFELFFQKAAPSVISQINYYYDDSEFSLFERNETLRVRQIGETLTLEYKHGKTRFGNVRKSKENTAAISVLPKLIKLDSLETGLIGCLLTERTDFLFEDIKVSLDKSIYLGTVDYELEIETNGVDELPQFLTAIIETVTCSPMGKYRRFASRLKAMGATYEI